MVYSGGEPGHESAMSSTPSMTPPPATAPQPDTPRDVREGERPGETLDTEMTPTRKRRRVTDSPRMLPLRMNRPVRRRSTEKRAAVVYDTAHTPAYLRAVRLFIGLALLAAAWGVILLVVALTLSLAVGLPHLATGLAERGGLWLLGALAMLWLSILALGLILVGAFSLTLALTRGRW